MADVGDRELLRDAARRAARNPFFLGYHLEQYKALQPLDDEGLARKLGCSVDTLVDLYLCRYPHPHEENYQRHLQTIADRFSVSILGLISALQEVRAQAALRERRALYRTEDSEVTALLAALDRAMGESPEGLEDQDPERPEEEP